MNVYWFQDSKTGHLKQVQALLDQLNKEIELSITTINYSNQKSLPEMLSNKNELDGPTILIGAGHGVYSKILQGKKYLRKLNDQDIFSIAVLRPSYKINSFDLIIAPEHDFRRRNLPKNVISFQGSLAPTSQTPIDENKAIICLLYTSDAADE